MAKIGVISLGCAKNQVNCEQMMYRLQEAGHEILPDVTGADVVLINTCGFIDSAKSEAIDHIIAMGQLKEAGVVGKILVTGCLSQRYQKEILEEMPEVDGLLGTGSYGDVVPAVEALLEGKPVASFGDIHQPEVETGRVLTTPQHYAYLKIAEGCDNHCAYCVIPSLRGRYRSRQMDDVLYEARNRAADGVKGRIVVAQDTSRYGTDLPGHKRLLAELLRQLCRIDGIHWVRVHYLYPDEIDEELMEVLAEEPKIGAYVEALFRKLRERIPGLVLRTSLITGLPGEGEEEFAQLCQFLKRMKLERVGAFSFSPEEGTPAAAMEHPDAETAQARAEIIEELQSRIMDQYNESLLGKTMEVLCDGYDPEEGR
ncbi:MAG: ribosomal protein S12 methylthiotransferase RimO, partial [Firmicutes bacterium CAG:137_57_8]